MRGEVDGTVFGGRHLDNYGGALTGEREYLGGDQIACAKATWTLDGEDDVASPNTDEEFLSKLNARERNLKGDLRRGRLGARKADRATNSGFDEKMLEGFSVDARRTHIC